MVDPTPTPTRTSTSSSIDKADSAGPPSPASLDSSQCDRIRAASPSGLTSSTTTQGQGQAQNADPPHRCNAEHNFNEQTNYLPWQGVVKIFLVLGLIDFIALMDTTTLAASLTIIGEDLDAGAKTNFISNAYFLTSTACQPLYGRVSDIVGRRPLLLVLLVLFFVGSLGSSLSPSYLSLILFRAVVGIGGGGIATVAQIIVSDVVPLRQRGKYQGILGALVALANGIGPVVGGALSSNTQSTGGWRNIFRLNLPVAALGIGATVWVMPLRKVQGDWRAKLRAIDWIGAALVVLAAASVVFGLTWVGVARTWNTAAVLAPLLAGAAITLLFLVWEGSADRPVLMPLWIFRSPVVCGAGATHFANGWLSVSQTYVIPQFYQLVCRYSAVRAGLMLIPLSVVQTVVSSVAGLVVTWTGRYRELLLLGWACWSVGLGLMATLGPQSGVARQVGYSILAGVGAGNTMQPSLIAIQSAVPRKTMATVTATRTFLRNLGGSIGLALCGTIVQLYLPDLPPAATDPVSAEGQANREYVGAYREGFRTVFISLAALGACAFLVCLVLVRQVGLKEREQEEEQRSGPPEKGDEKEDGRVVPDGSLEDGLRGKGSESAGRL